MCCIFIYTYAYLRTCVQAWLIATQAWLIATQAWLIATQAWLTSVTHRNIYHFRKNMSFMYLNSCMHALVKSKSKFIPMCLYVCVNVRTHMILILHVKVYKFLGALGAWLCIWNADSACVACIHVFHSNGNCPMQKPVRVCICVCVCIHKFFRWTNHRDQPGK